MKSIFFYETSIGKVGIADNGLAITDVFFNDCVNYEGFTIEETVLIKRAFDQLQEYFAGSRQTFDLPLSDETGTEFQKSVWQALLAIPYGETRSYKQVAEFIGNPKAVRAVGMANNRNPISIFVPCHRVIGADGKLVGYGGGLDIKEKLLHLEKNNKIGV